MSFNVNILGCGSATPTLRHNPSCQVIEHNGNLYMIDCGEGAQLAMRRQGLNFSRLRHIFISHLHGDHVFGLPGLLSTFTLQDVTGDVHLYMFPEGLEIMKQLLDTFSHAPTYNLVCHPLEVGKKIILDDKNLTVETFSLNHRMPAVGFIFREKQKPRHLIADMLEFYKVPIRCREAIKNGADFVKEDGTVVPNKFLTSAPDPSSSYAYCSDTMYNPGVVSALKNVNVLYHEATYGDDKADKASPRGHSTARQAGKAAREANVDKLIIGHYSKAYTGREVILLEQAMEEFPNTMLADEGLIVKV